MKEVLHMFCPASLSYCHGAGLLGSYQGSGPAGFGAQQARKLCPPDIEVAYQSGPKSCTLSGPAGSMKNFLKILHKEGLFAEMMNCGNIAHHSKHVSSVGPLLLKYLKEVKHHLCL
jgi:fatty acid synthase